MRLTILMICLLLSACKSNEKPETPLFDRNAEVVKKPIIRGEKQYKLEIMALKLEVDRNSEAYYRVKSVLDNLRSASSEESLSSRVLQNYLRHVEPHWPGVITLKKLNMNIKADHTEHLYLIKEKVRLDSEVLDRHLKLLPELRNDKKLRATGKKYDESWRQYFVRQYDEQAEKEKFSSGFAVNVKLNSQMLAEVNLQSNVLSHWETISWARSPIPVFITKSSRSIARFKYYSVWDSFGINQSTLDGKLYCTIIAARIIE